MFKHKLYRVEKRKLECHALPPAGRAFLVFQNGFGYSVRNGVNPRREKRSNGGEPAHLITTGTTCHVIGLSQNNGPRILFHVDPAFDVLTGLYRAMAYLVKQGVIRSTIFDDAQILTSLISASVRRTYLAMQLLGCRPQVYRSIPLLRWIGYLQDGKLIVYDQDSLKARQATIAEFQRNTSIRIEASTKRTFHCSNDDRYHQDARPFEILPGVPAFEIETGKNGVNGRYLFNISTSGFEFFPFRVPRYPGVHLELKECRHGEYVNIWSEEVDGPLRAATIMRVQTALFAVAEQIALSSKMG